MTQRIMNDGLKHPSHTGSFVRKKGGWGSYHKWCVKNGYATLVPDKNGKLFPLFIIKPIVVEKKVGRNDPCQCGSNLKYKRCCL